MKVLKNNDFIHLTCPHCSSELEVYREDILVRHVFGHDPNIWIICAACEKEIKLESKQIPEKWKDLLIDPNEDD